MSGAFLKIAAYFSSRFQIQVTVQENFRLSKYQLVGEDYHASVIKNCAGLLMEWALTRELALPEYETASVSGPAHNRTFVMVCKFQDNQTQGEILFKMLIGF